MPGRGRDLLIPAWAKARGLDATKAPSNARSNNQNPIGTNHDSRTRYQPVNHSSTRPPSAFSTQMNVIGGRGPMITPPSLGRMNQTHRHGGRRPQPLRPPVGLPPPIPGLKTAPPILVPLAASGSVEMPKTFWKQYTREGKTYYHNSKTNESVWTEPEEFKTFKAKLDSILGNPTLGARHTEARQLLSEHVINADTMRQAQQQVQAQTQRQPQVQPMGTVPPVMIAPHQAVRPVQSVQIGAGIGGVPGSIKTVDLTKVTAPQDRGMPKFSDRSMNEVLLLHIPRQLPITSKDCKRVSSVLDRKNKSTAFIGMLLDRKTRKAKNKAASSSEKKSSSTSTVNFKEIRVYTDLRTKEKPFFELLFDKGVKESDKWEKAVQRGLANDIRYDSVMDVEAKKRVLKKYQEWKKQYSKRLYQQEQVKAEQDLQSLLDRLSQGEKPRISPKTRSGDCMHLLETEFKSIYHAVDGNSARDRMVKNHLNRLYEEETKKRREKERELKQRAKSFLQKTVLYDLTQQLAAQGEKKKAITLSSIESDYKTLSEELRIPKDLFHVDQWLRESKEWFDKGKYKEVAAGRSISDEEVEGIKYILKNDHQFARVWKEVAAQEETKVRRLEGDRKDHLVSLTKQARTAFFSFLYAGFVSGKFDLEVPFANKDDLKKLETSLKGLEASGDVAMEEEGSSEKKASQAKKYLATDLVDVKEFRDLVILDRKAVAKEYEYVMKRLDEDISRAKNVLKAVTKLDGFQVTVEAKEFLPAVKQFHDNAVEKNAESLQGLNKILEKYKLEVPTEAMDEDKQNGAEKVENPAQASGEVQPSESPTEDSAILSRLGKAFGKVVLDQAVEDLVEDFKAKIKKYKKIFKNLLSDVIHKSDHVTIQYEEFKKKMKDEPEFIDLNRFNTTSVDHCKAVFEEYMEKFRERKSRKRKKEASVKDPSKKAKGDHSTKHRSRSNSSDKEDGEILDDD